MKTPYKPDDAFRQELLHRAKIGNHRAIGELMEQCAIGLLNNDLDDELRYWLANTLIAGLPQKLYPKPNAKLESDVPSLYPRRRGRKARDLKEKISDIQYVKTLIQDFKRNYPHRKRVGPEEALTWSLRESNLSRRDKSTKISRLTAIYRKKSTLT
jgi:hypothetical protein